MRIGNRSGATDRTFDGSISKVKMWNRVLTAGEIATDYAGRLVKDGLILNVPLATDYNDKSDTGLTGTNSGSRLTAVDDQVATAIKTARALGGATDNFMIGVINNKIMTAVVEET